MADTENGLRQRHGQGRAGDLPGYDRRGKDNDNGGACGAVFKAVVVIVLVALLGGTIYRIMRKGDPTSDIPPSAEKREAEAEEPAAPNMEEPNPEVAQHAPPPTTQSPPAETTEPEVAPPQAASPPEPEVHADAHAPDSDDITLEEDAVPDPYDHLEEHKLDDYGDLMKENEADIKKMEQLPVEEGNQEEPKQPEGKPAQ